MAHGIAIPFSAEMMRHVQLGAALHGMTPDDYLNTVVRRYIIAANGALLMSKPRREGALALDALFPTRKAQK